MPFKSLKQEMAMRMNAPEVWREWVRKYGHAPGYKQAVKKIARKAARSRKRSGRKKGGGK